MLTTTLDELDAPYSTPERDYKAEPFCPCCQSIHVIIEKGDGICTECGFSDDSEEFYPIDINKKPK